MTLFRFYPAFLLSLLCILDVSKGDGVQNPFVGGWGFTLPDGRAGWLGVKSNENQIHVEMLWGGGSVFDLDGARLDGDRLLLTRLHKISAKQSDGKMAKTNVAETIIVTTDGDARKFISVMPDADDGSEVRSEFSGRRLPPMPPAPDLSKVKFGEPMPLFNGHDLTGWKLVETNAINGWGARDGILFNDAPQKEGGPRLQYGNLRTVVEFEDFMLHAETRVPKDGNSGIYIRGIDEVQVYDTYGKPLDSHNMGAIYSRIKPTASAEKPAGEWQTLDITYVDRHATVVLNGVKIIDNQPVFGPTGGALWPEVDRPGPIYLQGDHTSIEYRNIILRRVVN
jgi:hypothetical protein